MRPGPALRRAVLAPLIVVAVAALVVAVGVLGAAVAGGPGGPTFSAATDASTDGPPPEYAPGNASVDPIPATGTVSLDRSLRAGDDPKTVVIEYSARVPPERFRPLVSALVRAGHEVRFRRELLPDTIPVRPPPLSEDLAAADAYVRIDPRTPMTDGEIEEIRAFTDRGGHLVILAEPDRRRLETSLLSTSLVTIRTDAVPLAAEYGIVFGNRYLYDTTRNDGNFRNVLVEPTGAATAPDLDRAALSTATHVAVRTRGRNASVVARTLPSTHLSDGGPACPYPVAVRTENALAIGDTTFMAEGTHNVAGNERLIAYVAGFAVSADQVFIDRDVIVPDYDVEDEDGGEEGADDESGTATENETGTGTATPTTATEPATDTSPPTTTPPATVTATGTATPAPDAPAC